MDKRFDRTSLLIGDEKLQVLKDKKVAIFGIGGVGGYVVETLVRSGIEHFALFDADEVDITNLNRQIIALDSSIGQKKVQVMKNRMLDINPCVEVMIDDRFLYADDISFLHLEQYDYIVDAIDTISTKIALIVEADQKNVPIISSMGTGNKLNPSLLRIDDIYKTSICPLARVMRYELRKQGIKKLKVVYSIEKPISLTFQRENVLDNGKVKRYPGSFVAVPAVAGFLLASEVIKDLLN